MQLAQGLFLAGAIPTVGGIAILVMLAPRPRTVRDHLQGAARYLMASGAAFGMARVFLGWVPSLDIVLLVLGLGLGMGIYARENNLIALAEEKLKA